MAQSTALIVANSAMKRIDGLQEFGSPRLRHFNLPPAKRFLRHLKIVLTFSGKSARSRRYRLGLFAVPFRKKAKAVLPSSAAIGAGGLSRNANSNPPAVSPAMKTPTRAIIATPLSHDGG
jgi:hypothetical protein